MIIIIMTIFILNVSSKDLNIKFYIGWAFQVKALVIIKIVTTSQ